MQKKAQNSAGKKFRTYPIYRFFLGIDLGFSKPKPELQEYLEIEKPEFFAIVYLAGWSFSSGRVDGLLIGVDD